MKTLRWPLLTGFVVALVAAAWHLVPAEDTEPHGGRTGRERRSLPTVPADQPTEPGPTAPAASPAVSGVVTQGGSPVPAAEVLLYRAEESPGPTVSCGPGESEVHLRDLDYISLCPRAADQVFALAAAGQFEDVPLASTRSGEDGRFAFPAPAGDLVVLARTVDGAAGLRRGVRAGDEVAIALSGEPTRGRVDDQATDPRSRSLGAEVLLGVASPRIGYARVTAAPDGTFQAHVPAEEKLWLLIRAPGFAATVDFWLPSAGETERFEIVRRRRIAGTVIEAGAGAPGVEVRTPLQLTSRIITDRLGRFSTDELGMASPSLEAERAGKSASLVVSAPGDQDQVTLDLEPSLELRVRVADATTGEPLPEAEVFATGDGSRLITLLKQTSPALFVGRAPREDLYRFHAVARGFASAQVSEQIQRGRERPIELRLWRAGELRGRVPAESGGPAAHRGVQACRRSFGEEDAGDSSTSCESAITSSDGWFYLPNLRPGTYLLSVLECPDPGAEPFLNYHGDRITNCPVRFVSVAQVPADQPVFISLAPASPARIDVSVEAPGNHCGCILEVECGQEFVAGHERYTKREGGEAARFEVESGVCVASVDCFLGLADGPCGSDTASERGYAQQIVVARPGSTTAVRFKLAHSGDNSRAGDPR